MYQIEVRHEGLNKYRVITGRFAHIVEEKARVQRAAWDEMWARQDKRKALLFGKALKKETAAVKTAECERAILQHEKILVGTLGEKTAFDWEQLKSRATFDTPYPIKQNYLEPPRQPLPTDQVFTPVFGLLDWLLPSRRHLIRRRKEVLFEEHHQEWEKSKHNLELENASIDRRFEQQCKIWKKNKDTFEAKQNSSNFAIDALHKKYDDGDVSTIKEYCDIILDISSYPDQFPKNWEIEFDENTGILALDYQLPSRTAMPTTKEFKYVSTRDAIDTIPLKEKYINSLYDSVVYQICLRTLYELFSADRTGKIASIVFNGWVNYINPATGTETRACIVSIHTDAQEFGRINLSSVDPKTCFRALKGIGSSQLYAMAPIQPIIQLQKEDHRFVASADIASKLNQGTNVAAIGWEEFEHLIRQIFEREFSANGGEVKVTQATRDGGVDAVAFDPDPIRGGKIVIQAKRYTNTVDVSSVRDLYGTVMNEGAIKGILVTTSDYGPDAYNFAKDKPITLLNGNNLLFLLSKHGYHAHIDISEAKKLGLSMQRHSL